MSPFDLQGNTLGEKHRHYNNLVNEAVKRDETLQPLDHSADNDIENLIKIDVACRTKNVDYILDVLKCEDELYVSKAIKRSKWLITDPQYAHIINPEYMYTELYPQMTLRAFNKFMLNIRVHLKDEKRAETFYDYIKEKDVKSAHKWLQYCSLPFIEKVDDIEEKTRRRLYKKSFSVYEAHITKYGYYFYGTNESDSVLKKFPEKVMDIVESSTSLGYYRFGPKATKILMTKYPNRILDKFGLYGRFLHIATFAKYLKGIMDIEEFLLKHVDLNGLCGYDKIQHFIKHMPEERRFEFVRKTFIDKDDDKEDSPYKKIAHCVTRQRQRRGKNTHVYIWYKFAPFEIACRDLDKLIRAEPLPLLRNSMLQILLSCAGQDKKHIQAVLQYYHNKHFNEAFKFKIHFVNCFISNCNTHDIDDQSWKLLWKLFHSMEVFIESGNNVQSCIKAIIIRNAIRNEPVPDIIEKKFVFDTLKTKQHILKKQEEKEAIYRYLQDFLARKSNKLNLTVEPDFEVAVTLCQYQLQLIRDWGEELQDHPYALDRVKELITIKKEKQWSRDLTALYNIKKSWRKLMFEESIMIMQNEAVCMNALKHDSRLLSCYKDQIMAMSCNDTVSLRKMLQKIRIYWSHTLAEDWKTIYIARLNLPYGHRALINGLCALLSRQQLDALLKKHAPCNTKITWTEIDQLELSLCKQIAKNIYKARPLPSIEGILLYAKGDYLQYVVPSIDAVFSQMSPIKIRTNISILLNAPVSLKKFGVRIAIRKLNSGEITPILSEIWDSTKYTSIRTVIFTHTYQLLCKGMTTSNIKDTWKMLSMFIDNLNYKDNSIIFKKLGTFWSVPASVQPQFYMKSFAFLTSLPAKCNCEKIFNRMQYSATDYIDYFDDEFVIKVLLNNFEDIFDKKRDTYDLKKGFLSAYMLTSVNEETQIQRYEQTLDILLEQYLPQWEKDYVSNIWLKNVLGKLVSDLEVYTFEKKMTIPSKIFEKILVRLETTLCSTKHYVFLTTWKLVTAFMKLLNENKEILDGSEKIFNKTINEEEKQKMFDVIHENIAPRFSNICKQYLKEDIIQFGNSIYLLFAEALKTFLHCYLPGIYKTKQSMIYLKCLLQCGNETELFLMVCQVFVISDNFINIGKNLCEEINNIVTPLIPHCSDETKMHFDDVIARITLSSRF